MKRNNWESRSIHEGLLSKSLFDENKIIIINYATDKILKVVEKITSICDENTKIILNSDALEKKSKLRIFLRGTKFNLYSVLSRRN